KDVPSREIIITVVSGLLDRLNEKGIELHVANNLPTICCDRDRVCQVFENLIVNAIKFIGDKKTPKIEIGYKERAKRAEFHQFYVKDTGIGIAPEYHRKIFERFQRLKEIEDEEGTGLGLAIVERIVNNHGGRVWVESKKGKGATFYFTLPKAS
ncbi:MAG: GHKL domain-containing protein, partial [Desulfobacterales bacterium]